MRLLLVLYIILTCTAPLYADQALVLTEIEQIQEKIWYLQRDVAAQKTALDKQQQNINSLHEAGQQKLTATGQKLDALVEQINNQQEKTRQLESSLQGIQESVTALVNEFNQQNAAQLQQAQKSGTQEGFLQALRDEVDSNRKRTEEALAETERKLTEAMTQLATMKQQKNSEFDRIGLYTGGAALALAILLTIGFAILNKKSNRRDNNKRTHHEL